MVYEALDLSTPEAAVETFTDAFARSDYYTVYFTLHYDAQNTIARMIGLFQLDGLYDTSKEEAVSADSSLLGVGIGRNASEHSELGAFVFDDIMWAADQNDALLIDLRGAVTINDTATIEIDDDRSGIAVSAAVEGIQGEVTFITEQSASGRWRVLEVSTMGADGDLIRFPALPPRN